MDETRPGLSPSRGELRGFGVGLGVLLALLAAFAWRHRSPAAAWELGGATVLWALAAFAPGAFAPLYRLWMPVVFFLARVNTAVLLGVFYVLVLTPYAALLRLLKTPLLDLRLRDRDSYWVPREPPEGPESYRRMF